MTRTTSAIGTALFVAALAFVFASGVNAQVATTTSGTASTTASISTTTSATATSTGVMTATTASSTPVTATTTAIVIATSTATTATSTVTIANPIVVMPVMVTTATPVTFGSAIPLCEIQRSLKVGSTGDDVKCLQKFLNFAGYTVAATGAGSVGNESAYFGPATASAVMKWQTANAAQVLASGNATGIWGTASFNYYVTLVHTALGVK